MLLFSTEKQTNGKTLKQSEVRKSEGWPKNTQGKDKVHANYADSENILTDQEKMQKVTEFKYLGQNTLLKDSTKEEIYAKIIAAWSCFEKKNPRKYLIDRQLPISLKKQVMGHCVLPTMTHGCQTWSLNNQLTNKLRTAQ